MDMEYTSPATDYVVIEPNYAHNLAIRTRSRQDGVDQYLDDPSIDSGFEYISRPGSVRSLCTKSPSPSTTEDNDSDDGLMTSTNQHNSNINADPQNGMLSQADHVIFDHFPTPKPVDQTSTNTVTADPLSSPYTYQRSPDDVYTGAGVLVPSKPAEARQALAAFTFQRHSISVSDINALRNNACHERCDHTTIDTHIMDLLIENALNTRLEREFGTSAARDRQLRQEMMARLRSLPVDHHIVKEAMRVERWASFLFQHQHCSAAERRHIYAGVFTAVELTALHLLRKCHANHFSITCSFADLPHIPGFGFPGELDRCSMTKGVELALQIQTTCMMSIGFREVRRFLNQNQLWRCTRTAILHQADQLRGAIDIRVGSMQHETNMSNTDTMSLKNGEVEALKHAYYERIAVRDVFNDTLTSLSAAHLQGSSRNSLCLKREAPEEDADAASLLSTPPAKKLSIPGAYPASVEARFSTSTPAPHPLQAPTRGPLAAAELPRRSGPFPCFVCSGIARPYDVTFDYIQDLTEHLCVMHTICSDQRACNISGSPCLGQREHEQTGKTLALIMRVRAAEKETGKYFRSMTTVQQQNILKFHSFLEGLSSSEVLSRQDMQCSAGKQASAYRPPLGCFLCTLESTKDFIFSEVEDLKAHLYSKHCRVWSAPEHQFRCPKCDKLVATQLQLDIHLPNCSKVMHGGALSMAFAYLGYVEAAEKYSRSGMGEKQTWVELASGQVAGSTFGCKSQRYELLEQQRIETNAGRGERSDSTEQGPSTRAQSQRHAKIPANIAASKTGLQAWQMQLKLLEQQNKQRLMLKLQESQSMHNRIQTDQSSVAPGTTPATRSLQLAPQSMVGNVGPSMSTNHQQYTQQQQLMPLECQNKSRRMLAMQKSVTAQGQVSASHVFPSSKAEPVPITVPSHSDTYEHSYLQDYQTRMMRLMQQNKQLLMLHNQTIAVELSKYVNEEDTNKFRCKVPDHGCTKLFKGRSYWKEHVQRRHKDWYEALTGGIRNKNLKDACGQTSIQRETTDTMPTTDPVGGNTLSSYEDVYRGADPPASGFFPDGSTFVAKGDGRKKDLPAERAINGQSTALPFRPAASKIDTAQVSQTTSNFSSGCHDNPNIEPVSSRRGFNKVSAVESTGHAAMSNRCFDHRESQRPATISDNPKAQRDYEWQVRLVYQADQIRSIEQTLKAAKPAGACTRELCREVAQETLKLRAMEAQAQRDSESGLSSARLGQQLSPPRIARGSPTTTRPAVNLTSGHATNDSFGHQARCAFRSPSSATRIPSEESESDSDDSLSSRTTTYRGQDRTAIHQPMASPPPAPFQSELDLPRTPSRQIGYSSSQSSAPDASASYFPSQARLDAARDAHRRQMLRREDHCIQDYETQLQLLEQQRRARNEHIKSQRGSQRTMKCDEDLEGS